MKMIILSALVTAASVVVIPAVPVLASQRTSAQAETAPANDEKPAPAGYYKVLCTSTGEVREVPVREYVIGAVCAEMPAAFEEEALKAQAVAAHTYAERQHLRELASPTPGLCGADLSDDTSVYQGFLTEEEAKKCYGENADAYYSRISEAVDEVLPYIITFDDEPIIAAFHSISPGMTESAGNAWGTDVEYLIPVDSSEDTSAPRYLDEQRFSAETLRYMLETAFPGISLGEDMTEWLSVIAVSPSGTVISARAGDLTVTGYDVKQALSLRSPAFDVRYEDGDAVVTTRGFGHGVGMSQYGANSMAAAGSSWQEIIAHYYPSCELTELDRFVR